MFSGLTPSASRLPRYWLLPVAIPSISMLLGLQFVSSDRLQLKPLIYHEVLQFRLAFTLYGRM